MSQSKIKFNYIEYYFKFSFLELYQSAMDLYGLIHQRYILTSSGLDKMRIKYLNGTFGICPRVLCNKQLALPIGMSEELSISRVKIFCPKCDEVYIPGLKFVDIDGAYFGKSFPNIFFQTFPELIIDEPQKLYVPKIYGFKIFFSNGSNYQNKNINDPNPKKKSKNN